MNEHAIQNKELLVPAQAMNSAIQALHEAEKRHEQALATSSESEQRMRELQARADESHLSVIESEAAAAKAKEELVSYHTQESEARSKLDEAYAILEEAKKLVVEQKECVKEAEMARAEVEKRFIPVFAQLLKSKSAHERLLAMSSMEAVRLRRRVAGAEEKLLEQRVAVCDAKISLIESSDPVLAWPDIKGLIGEGL